MALKKLVGRNKLEYWIDREKVSAIHEIPPRPIYIEGPASQSPKTRFIVDGQEVFVDIHLENAMNWFNSTD